MDSFDIMGQFDSMLSPGDVYRKTFDTALMGLESKGGGGGGGGGGDDDAEERWEEQADLAHEQNMNSYEYNWDQAQRDHNHQLLQNQVQRHDQAVQNAYQTAQQEQQWMYANALQEQEYNSQVAAYNKAEKMYGHQIQMNQIAATMAIENQTAQTNERFQDLQFQVYQQGLDYQTKKTELAQRGAGVDLDIYSKRTAADRKKQGLTIQEQTKRGTAALQSQDLAVQGMQALGQAKSRGQAGRSAEKQYQSITAQIGRVQEAKAYELNRSDLAYRLAMNGVDQTMAEQQAGAELSRAQIGAAGASLEAANALAKDQQDATALSIRGANRRSIDKIHHDQYAANIAADFGRMSAPTMGVPIPKPLQIPMATILDPPLPVLGEPPVWGAGMGPVPQGGGGGGGRSGGSGFFGGMMTGASMGAAGGWWGAGIGAVVGGIGGAFGWI